MKKTVSLVLLISFVLCILSVFSVLGADENTSAENIYFEDFDSMQDFPTNIITSKNAVTYLDDTMNYPYYKNGKSVCLSLWDYYVSARFCGIFSAVEKGNTYIVSAMMRLSDESEMDSGTVFFNLLDENYQKLDYIGNGGSDCAKTITKNEWTRITFSFVAGDNFNTAVLSSARPASEPGKMLLNVDNVTVKCEALESETNFYSSFENGVKISNIEYLKKGPITTETVISNNMSSDRMVDIISAVYNNNSLIKVKAEKVTVPAKQKTEVNLTHNIDENVDDSYFLKVFVWNDMAPKCVPKTISGKSTSPKLPEITNQNDKADKLPDGDTVLNETALFTEGYNKSINPEFDSSYANYWGYSYNASFDIVDVSNESVPFNNAVRVSVDEVPPTANGVRIGISSAEKTINAGDVCLLTLYMRTIDAANDQGSAVVSCIFQTATDPWKKSLQQDVYTSGEWHKYYLPFTAAEDHTAGNSGLVLRFGHNQQVLELGGLSIVNYGNSVSINDMPRTEYDYYKGMEDDAPWRAEADERIKNVRMGNMSIAVKDSSGNPIPNANVSVNMKEHEFDFGGVMWSAPSSNPEGEFFDNIKKNFNITVPGNALKWPKWESSPQTAVSAVEWAKANGLKVRGHTLIWDSLSHMPSDIKEIEDDKDKVSERIESHIKYIVGTLKGKVDEWDVLNEPVMNKNLQTKYGQEIFVDWFKWAREADPDAKLYVNETGIVGYDYARVREFHRILEKMVENNVDFDAIGIQGHFSTPCSPIDFYNQIDELSKYGKEIKITEYSISASDEMSAHFTRDLLTAVFSHENVNGFVIWNHSDSDGSNPNAVMYDSNWNLKPAGEQILDLIYNKWHTDELGKADENGIFNLRAFYGTYTVTVNYGDKLVKKDLVLTKNGDSVFEITLE
ncbi:MAG: endo-1,4-beta-xylanase [Clostridia bacterium]|nr:endo-1,4-beta-xylanase [Clostridia bacterium]